MNRDTLMTIIECVVAVLIFSVVAGIVVTGINDASKKSDAEEQRIAEESIRSAIVTCYAVEGSYPDTFDYIKKNYNVSIDEKKFAVHYTVFASNVMPDFDVVRR